MGMTEVCELSGDEELLEQGWERRSILEEPRLSEAVEMYKQMGLEVKVVTLTLEMLTGCSTCLAGPIHKYKVVYTRGPSEDYDDDFF